MQQQLHHMDPSRGHLTIVPTLNLRTPLMQPTAITKKIMDQIYLFQSIGVFVMVYGSTCFKEQFGFDLQFMASCMMTFAICNHPSNSNLNPMVTLAFCLRNTKRYQWVLLGVYWKAQMTGALIGVVSTFILNGRYRGPLVPMEDTIGGYFRVMMSECVGVFVLIIIVLQVVGPNTIYTTKKFSRYIYIALQVYIGRKYAPTSGTALNACITLSRAIMGIWYADWQGLRYYLLWLIGDIIGCLLGTYLYNQIIQPCIVHARIKKMKRYQEEQKKIFEMQEFSRISFVGKF